MFSTILTDDSIRFYKLVQRERCAVFNNAVEFPILSNITKDTRIKRTQFINYNETMGTHQFNLPEP